MRLLRLAFIPSLACALSCSGPAEERPAAAPNPVQPLLGNPIAFPTINTTPVISPSASPAPSPSPSTGPFPTPRTTPTPNPSPSATPSPTPTPSPSATPSPTPKPSPTPTPSPTSPTPSPSPSATPPPGASGIHHLRVAFFGIICKNGKAEPNNGAGQLPVGCKGSLTATPKYANGDDVPATIHGPNIEWELETGGGIVQVKDSKTTIWNKDLIGLRVGTFSMCATVRDVRGCLNGTVTP